MEKEIASYPFVAHPLGIANDALIGVVNLPAFIDIAQHTALAIAHRAIGENVANALIIIVVDLQTLDEPNLLIALIANHTIAVEKTLLSILPSTRLSPSRTVPFGEMRPILW